MKLTMILIGLSVLFVISADQSSAATVSAIHKTTTLKLVGDTSQIYVNPGGSDTYNGESATYQGGIIGPKKTIKNAAATVADHGTIHIASGTYKETNIGISGKNVNFIGANRDTTIIDGTNTGRILLIGAQGVNYQFNLNSLTFTNGVATNNNGGAIYNYGTTTIENCAFTNNMATYGGGAIYGSGTGSSPGYLTIINSKFTGNSASANTASGGAILYAGFGALTVTNTDFSGNTAPKGSSIYNSLASSTTANFNRLIDTGSSVIACQTGSFVDATLNWWGSNANPSSKVSAGVTVNPWLVLTANANPTTINNGATSTITADLQHDSGILNNPTNPSLYYHNPTQGHVPDGINVNFASDTLGTVNPLTAKMVNGAASTTFTAKNPGTSKITSTVDTISAYATVTIKSLGQLTIVKADPANNAVDVALNKVIKITFNQAIKFGANPWIELKLTSAPGTAISFTPTISGSTLLITPKSLLKAGTQYTVILHTNSITTMNGIGLASPYVTRFTTSTAPVITSTSPANKAVNVALNTVVKFNFNKNIKFGANPWIEFKNSSGTTKPFTLSITGSTLNITPKTPLFRGTQYTVVIHSNSVTSLNGAGLAAPYTIKFSTTP